MTATTIPPAATFWERLLRRFPGLKQLIANPVVIRDVRAQMRGARSYWYIGGYLTLLSLLAIAGYAAATGQSLNPLIAGPGRNIVDAQGHLETFYFFIFLTLAALIILIAPALTAASIVGERQRQSFDLLVTTPLTAGHLLIGKLVSSIAFLGMLLLLSLPASALCILLGGASIGDVFRIYFLLTVDAIVLSAIGLYFSSAVRVPLLATVWTYVTVIAFLGITYWAATYGTNGASVSSLSPLTALVWLNPIIACFTVVNSEGGGLSLFLYLTLYLGFAFLFLRLLLTAATYRLGLYGAQSGVSLRKQALLVSGLLMWLMSSTIMGRVGEVLKSDPFYTAFIPLIGYLFFGAFFLAVPFLPGLFVPATSEDAPPGAVADAADAPARHHVFSPKRLFRPEHAGALPWYVAFVLTITAGVVAGTLPYGVTGTVAGIIGAGEFYLLTMGFLMWSLSRLAGSVVSDLSSARAMAFAFFIAVAGLPLLLLAVGDLDWQRNPLASLWLLSPALYNDPEWMMYSFVCTGVIAASIAAIVFLVDRGIRRR